MKAYFFSDIHLHDSQDPNYSVFLKFLKGQSKANTSHLFLLGDIFDVWVGPHNYYYEKFKTVVDEIHRLSKEGVEVHFFEGNHDFTLSGFWDKQIGAQVYEGPQEINLQGLNFRIEHGDQTNPHDLSYIRLRSFLRSRYMEWLIRHVPERFVAWVGETWSPLSRKRKKPYVNQEVRKITHDYAKALAELSKFDVMVVGHTHMHDDFSFDSNGKRRRFINLGTWLEKPRVLQLENGQMTWREL